MIIQTGVLVGSLVIQGIGGVELGPGYSSRDAVPAFHQADSVQLWAARLSAMTATTSIGVLDGEHEYTFGRLEDGYVDKEARVWALDRQFRELRAFHADGTHLLTGGRPGAGPGEFTAPIATTASPGGDGVLILDASGRVAMLRMASGSLDYDDGFRLEFSPRDFCRIGQRLYIHGLDRANNLTVHVYDLSGRRIHSFARAPEADSWVLKVQLTRGLISCHPEDSTVATVPAVDSVLRVYTADGQLRRTATIPDFNRLEIRQVEGGAVTNSLPEGQPGYDRIETLVAIPDGLFLVQVGYFVPDRDRPVRRRSFLFDPATASLERIDDELPRILSVTRTRALSSSASPFPTLTIWDVPELEGAT